MIFGLGLGFEFRVESFPVTNVPGLPQHPPSAPIVEQSVLALAVAFVEKFAIPRGKNCVNAIVLPSSKALNVVDQMATGPRFSFLLDNGVMSVERLQFRVRAV